MPYARKRIFAKYFSSRVMLPISIIVIAIAVIIQGALQAISAIQILPSSETLDQVLQQTPPSPENLDKLIQDQIAALATQEDPSLWGTLGLSLMMASARSSAEPPKPGDGSNLDRARLALTHSIALAPANPYVWGRLALISETEPTGLARSLALWRYCQETGPNEPRLRISRTAMALPLWYAMSGIDHQNVYADIARAWPGWPSEEAGAPILDIAQTPLGLSMIRASLVTDIKQLQSFEKYFAERLRNQKTK